MQKEIDVLLLGSSDSGKSILMEILSDMDQNKGVIKGSLDKHLPPTIGFDKQNLNNYSICELGSSMQTNQLKFVNKARSIIYLVNLNDNDYVA